MRRKIQCGSTERNHDNDGRTFRVLSEGGFSLARAAAVEMIPSNGVAAIA